jgi:hypothetical protein
LWACGSRRNGVLCVYRVCLWLCVCLCERACVYVRARVSVCVRVCACVWQARGRHT